MEVKLYTNEEICLLKEVEKSKQRIQKEKKLAVKRRIEELHEKQELKRIFGDDYDF